MAHGADVQPPTTPSGPAGGLVLAIVLLLSVVGLFLYSRPLATSNLAYHVVLDGVVLLAWIVAALGFGIWPTGALLGINARKPQSPLNSSDRRSINSVVLLATAAGIGLGLLGLLVLALGLLGALNQVSAIVLLAVGVAAGAAWSARQSKAVAAAARQPVVDQQDRPFRTRWLWLWLGVAPFLATALAASFMPPGLLWKPQEPHGYDVVEYHFQVPREWYEAGQIVPLEHNAFSYFPFGVEMHYLLAMHLHGGPWLGMFTAQLMHLVMVALAVLATCGFANQLAKNRTLAVIAPFLGATVPWLTQLAPLGFNEGGLLLFGTLSIGWTLLALRSYKRSAACHTNRAALTPSPGVPEEGKTARETERRWGYPNEVWRPLLLAAVMAGFACGVKLTAVPLLLLAIPFVWFVLLIRRSPGIAIKGAIGFGLIGLLLFSPWLIRNLVWAGNPVFPEGTAIFGNGHFSDVQIERWNSAHRAQPAQQSLSARLTAFGDQVLGSWQLGYVLLPLAVVALVLQWRSQLARALAILLGTQFIFWIGFTHLQGRFFVLAIPVAVMVLALTPLADASRLSKVINPLLAGLAIIVGLFGWWTVHERLAFKLYEEQGTGMLAAMANEDLHWLTDVSLKEFPAADPSAKLLLVGEAQAFWYMIPMSRLKYRTVFDLDTSQGRPLIDAFDPEGLRRDGKTWLLVSPSELARYGRTYQPLPPTPPRMRATTQPEQALPFLMSPAEAAKE